MHPPPPAPTPMLFQEIPNPKAPAAPSPAVSVHLALRVIMQDTEYWASGASKQQRKQGHQSVSQANLPARCHSEISGGGGQRATPVSEGLEGNAGRNSQGSLCFLPPACFTLLTRCGLLGCGASQAVCSLPWSMGCLPAGRPAGRQAGRPSDWAFLSL